MPSLQRAFDWCVEMCEGTRCGYSMNTSTRPTRYGDYYNGVYYYDCSSFLSTAVYEAGFTSNNTWFTTYDMGPILEDAGWHAVDPGGEWRAGDILVRDDGFLGLYAHTEMVYDPVERLTMGAHTNSVPLVDQVSIGTENVYGVWQYAYRYGEGLGGEPSGPSFDPSGFPWTNGSGYEWTWEDSNHGLEEGSEGFINNGKIIFWFLWNAGWDRTSIYAFLGNVQGECGMNPAEHELGGLGYGIVQWTPEDASDPNPLDVGLEVVYGTAADRHDGTRQMNVLLAEYMQTNHEQGNPFSKDTGIGRQWYNSSGSYYGFSLPAVDWYSWAKGTSGMGLDDLVKSFMVSYLRPAYSASVNHWEQRVNFAYQWAERLADYTPGGGGTGPVRPPSRGKRKGMPLWMMLYRF